MSTSTLENELVAAIRSAGGAARRPALAVVSDGWEEF